MPCPGRQPARESGSCSSSWIPQILPYFDQATLGDLYNDDFAFFEPPNRPAIETKLALFECASTPGGTQMTSTLRMRTASGWQIRTDRGAFTSDYAGQRGIHPGTHRIYAPGAAANSNLGIFGGGGSGRRFRDVTDGTTNTIIVHESAGRYQWLRRDRVSGSVVARPPEFGGWFDYWAGPSAGWMYGFEDNGLTTRGPRFLNASNKWANPFSFHTGGVQVALADGSARFLSDNMSNLVFIALCTRAGGEVVGEF
ncbi:MAG: DUF1559 domain-containing protein [Planctomycetes bacterium]|nr:DUF1559 domain-containing protein [Planctomycetota bacterium]